ncbi:MAG: hypothetical protein H6656_07255 [Ardenticatenaceae bacterium]|nr:hypothetical protein [Ardenticatenaceae bacterium]
MPGMKWFTFLLFKSFKIQHSWRISQPHEADLFVWLSQHRDRLQERYGEYENLADLAQFLADEYREAACLG